MMRTSPKMIVDGFKNVFVNVGPSLPGKKCFALNKTIVDYLMNFHLKSMYLHEVATEEIFCAVTLKNIKLFPEEIANLLF